MQQRIMICIYGADTICASCVNLPSSKDTYEWLQAALRRKYPDHVFEMEYIDINHPPDDEEKRAFSRKVIDNDLFYPVVVINGVIAGEGNPRLKDIYKELERYGLC